MDQLAKCHSNARFIGLQMTDKMPAQGQVSKLRMLGAQLLDIGFSEEAGTCLGGLAVWGRWMRPRLVGKMIRIGQKARAYIAKMGSSLNDFPRAIIKACPNSCPTVAFSHSGWSK